MAASANSTGNAGGVGASAVPIAAAAMQIADEHIVALAWQSFEDMDHAL